VRLLREAGRHGNDPELFAGLVHVLRYCGLFEQAIVAHEEARRLDPNVPTSYEQTLLVAGDIERLLAVTQRLVGSGDEGIRVIALGMAGRRDEARRELLHMGEGQNVTAFRPWKEYLLAWLDRRVADMADTRTFLGDLKIMDDPEAIFQEGWALCDVGEYERGLPHLQRAVAKGYFVAPTLETRPQFDGLRGDPRFQKLLEEAKAGRQRALAVFNEEDGERLCGCCAP
jgi:tetratricopeptide (TPR) repeat protein